MWLRQPHLYFGHLFLFVGLDPLQPGYYVKLVAFILNTKYVSSTEEPHGPSPSTGTEGCAVGKRAVEASENRSRSSLGSLLKLETWGGELRQEKDGVGRGGAGKDGKSVSPRMQSGHSECLVGPAPFGI